MPTDQKTLIANLRVISALADRLALDLEANRLWEGEASDSISMIRAAANNLPTGRI